MGIFLSQCRYSYKPRLFPMQHWEQTRTRRRTMADNSYKCTVRKTKGQPVDLKIWFHSILRYNSQYIIFSFASRPFLSWDGSQLEEGLNKMYSFCFWGEIQSTRKQGLPTEFQIQNYESTVNIPTVQTEFHVGEGENWINQPIKPGRSIVIHQLPLWRAVL
jgi:hypothetical protein